MVSNRMFSNAQFLTMEENSFAAVNAKKKAQKIISFQTAPLGRS